MRNIEKHPTELQMNLIKSSFSDEGLKMWTTLAQCASEDLTVCVSL